MNQNHKSDAGCLFGEKVREIRRRRNLSQSALAAKIGVCLNTIHLWENGKCRPGIGALARLAEYTDQPLSDFLILLDGEEEGKQVQASGRGVCHE